MFKLHWFPGINMKIALILSPLYVFLVFILLWTYQSTFTLPGTLVSFSILTPIVEAGQNFRFETAWVNHTSCRVTRSESLTNGIRQVRLKNEEFFIKPQIAAFSIQNLVHIPMDIPPGNYVFLVELAYFCNPMDYFLLRSQFLNYGPVEVVPPK